MDELGHLVLDMVAAFPGLVAEHCTDEVNGADLVDWLCQHISTLSADEKERLIEIAKVYGSK